MDFHWTSTPWTSYEFIARNFSTSARSLGDFLISNFAWWKAAAAAAACLVESLHFEDATLPVPLSTHSVRAHLLSLPSSSRPLFECIF